MTTLTSFTMWDVFETEDFISEVDAFIETVHSELFVIEGQCQRHCCSQDSVQSESHDPNYCSNDSIQEPLHVPTWPNLGFQMDHGSIILFCDFVNTHLVQGSKANVYHFVMPPIGFLLRHSPGIFTTPCPKLGVGSTNHEPCIYRMSTKYNRKARNYEDFQS